MKFWKLFWHHHRLFGLSLHEKAIVQMLILIFFVNDKHRCCSIFKINEHKILLSHCPRPILTLWLKTFFKVKISRPLFKFSNVYWELRSLKRRKMVCERNRCLTWFERFIQQWISFFPQGSFIARFCLNPTYLFLHL